MIARAILCAEPSEVFYLFFLEVLRQGHGLNAMIGVQGGAQQDKFVGGTWQIMERMAAMLSGQIILGDPVHTVTQCPASVKVASLNGLFEAARVIVTAPPPLVARMRFDPALPAKRLGLMRRMPMGCVIKVMSLMRPLSGGKKG